MGRSLTAAGPGATARSVVGSVDPLRGSRCGACGTVAFPVATGCQRCGGQQMAEIDLSSHGLIWGWTVQRFAPKSPPYLPPPEGFTPFAVGYVELPDGVTVEALLECADLEQLDVGLPVRLVGTEPVPRFATQIRTDQRQKGTD